MPTQPAEGLAGRAVTVVGLGRFGGGTGVTRWLCSQGARVTVSDKAGPQELAESLASIGDLDVQLHLGGHEADDFLKADLLVLNPAVPRDLPLLEEARTAGIPRTTEINMFLQRCPAAVVGITGSVGKSTTTAMTGAILSARLTTHVGGNIGGSLLTKLGQIEPDHVVAMELSSFQLEDLPLVGISPHVVVVTNLTPNHLDRHGSMAAYAAAKKNIFAFQSSEDVLVLNSRCSASSGWAREAHGRVEFFDEQDEPFDLAVPGRHNQANAQAAWAATRQFGLTRDQAAAALAEFAGLPHRLQFVAEIDGVRYYNDSKCTTPEGAIVAVEAFELCRSIVIAGGCDKGVQFDGLGKALAHRAKAVIAIGATSDKILAALREHQADGGPIARQAEDLRSAIKAARAFAEPGDVVLLSPACASYDMFTNYEQRGDEFVRLVQQAS